MIKFCRKYVFHYKFEFTIYFLLGIALCALNTFLPAIMGYFINLFETKITYSQMLNVIFLLFIMYISKEIISFFHKLLYIKIQANAAFALNFDIIEHLKEVSPLVIEKTDLSYLSQRINNDANDILIFFISSLTELIFSLFSIGIVLFIIQQMDTTAFIVTLVLLLFYILIYIRYKNKIYNSSYKMKEEKSNFFSRLQEQLEKSQFIKIHNMNTFFSMRLKKAYQELYKSIFKQQTTLQIFSNIESLIGALSVCILLWIGGKKILIGNMQIGYFYMISVYFNMILEYGKQIVMYGQEYQETYVSFERIRSIFDIKKQSNGSQILKNINEINIIDLNFSYDSKKVIKNFTMKLTKGTIYGIKGKNGCGKSTLIKILLGLYMDEYQGNIFWNNIEMRKLDVCYIREHILSITEQEPILIADTIYNNMVLYKNVNQEKLHMATDFFNDNILKEKNWNLQINEKSSNISGGEKQKITIIRQILQDRQVMIFDEPTSAMDENGKKQFIELINHIKSHKIIIIISHDQEILNNCEKLINLL